MDAIFSRKLTLMQGKFLLKDIAKGYSEQLSLIHLDTYF